MNAAREARIMRAVCAILFPPLAVCFLVEAYFLTTDALEGSFSGSMAVGVVVTGVFLFALRDKFKKAKPEAKLASEDEGKA